MIREAVNNAAGKGGTNEIEWIDAADTSTQNLVKVSAECVEKIGQ
jgi:hypothetical protein